MWRRSSRGWFGLAAALVVVVLFGGSAVFALPGLEPASLFQKPSPVRVPTTVPMDTLRLAEPAVVPDLDDEARLARELSDRGPRPALPLASDTATATQLPSPSPELSTPTQVPATATAVPATATAVPPTATAIPPTATRVPPTATRVPPTATRVPPTATRVPPTATLAPPPAPVPQNVSVAAEEYALGLVNQERRSRGLPLVTMSEPLRQVARAHAQDMAARNYFAHNTPEGLTPFDRMRRAGITYATAGENLGFSNQIADPVAAVLAQHQAMMAEVPPNDGHVRTMLNSAFRRVGIGVVITPDLRVYYACDFTN